MNLKEQKKFGFLFTLIFLLLSVYYKIINNELFIFFIFISSLIFFISIFFTYLLVLPYKFWMNLAFFLGKFFSPIIIFFQYFILFGITSLVIKIFKNDLINQKIIFKKSTYWQTEDNRYPENLNDQF